MNDLTSWDNYSDVDEESDDQEQNYNKMIPQLKKKEETINKNEKVAKNEYTNTNQAFNKIKTVSTKAKDSANYVNMGNRNSFYKNKKQNVIVKNKFINEEENLDYLFSAALKLDNDQKSVKVVNIDRIPEVHKLEKNEEINYYNSNINITYENVNVNVVSHTSSTTPKSKKINSEDLKEFVEEIKKSKLLQKNNSKQELKEIANISMSIIPDSEKKVESKVELQQKLPENLLERNIPSNLMNANTYNNYLFSSSVPKENNKILENTEQVTE